MKDLSMHIMDILQNSTRAKAKNIYLEVVENYDDDKLTLAFKDDGCGMSQEMLEKVTNPFFTTRTTRKVGLGLPLLKQNAEMTGGSFNIESQLGKGTEVTAVFGLSHIDRPPMGDLAGTFVLTFSANPDTRFFFHYQRFKNGLKVDYSLDTDDIYEVLEGVSIHESGVITYIRDMIITNIA